VPNRGQGPLALRLALAFVAVAVLAVAMVAVLAVAFTDKDISTLVAERHNDLTTALMTAAVSSYNTADGWSSADLGPALDLAGDGGAQTAILDASGRVVASTLPAHLKHSPGVIREPLYSHGHRIGALLIRYNNQGLAASASHVRTSLVSAVIGAAGLAAALALLAGVLVSRRITRPVGRLIETTRARGQGNRGARVGNVPGAPAELRELAAAFDHMADTIMREEQLQRDLVADVAHELRTPVAVLQANTEALLDGVIPHTPEQTASLHEEVLRLGRMVDDLQQLAAAQTAALRLSMRPCDLADVATGAADEWAASFANAGIEFSQRLEPAPVLGDPVRLHQIIGNLLSNALKFTPAGGQVAMTLAAADGQARLEVADSGPGISPQDQAHVFDRLFRGTHAAGTAGSGIGLAVAAELARAHDGTVEVTGEPGSGALFTVVLPLAPGDWHQVLDANGH
jgi:two-component system, OmpR family, sensor histidine kinase BaeS